MEPTSRAQWAAIAASVLAAHHAQPPYHPWKGANNTTEPPRKATKDRSKIKAARKQNRSRK